MLARKIEHHGDVLFVEYGTRGIARVDDADGFDPRPLGAGRAQGVIKHGAIELPVIGLVEVVGNNAPFVKRDGSAIERILRNGNHDAVSGRGQQKLENYLHASAGAVSEEDGLWIDAHSIALADKLGHRITDEAQAFALAVGSHSVPASFEDGPCGFDGIGGKDIGREIHQRGILAESKDLAQPGEGLLPQRLRVADVAVDDFLAQFFQFLRARNDWAAHSIFRRQHRGSEIFFLYGHMLTLAKTGLKGPRLEMELLWRLRCASR